MKTILITGASSGIGKATVELFAKKNYQVIATMRDPSKAKSFNWPKNVDVQELDITNYAQAKKVKNYILKTYKRLDILLNNAGYGIIGAVETYSQKDLEGQFRTNVFAPIELIKQFLPEMRKDNQGTIINVTSIGGRISFPYFGAYNASKHALDVFSQALHMELQRTKIKVKVIEPGFTQTNFAKSGMKTSEMSIEYYNEGQHELEDVMKVGEDGTPPSEIAELIYSASQDDSNKLRYAGGNLAKPLLIMKKLLPQTLFEKIILKKIKT
jgi:short-subunit dehydrogenase